jgi:hypothetical protein
MFVFMNTIVGESIKREKNLANCIRECGSFYLDSDKPFFHGKGANPK